MYTGEQVDATGLQYLRARYYDAGTGRFASRDPLPLAQRYAYVGGNPVNLVDPSGLCPWGTCLPDPRGLADPLINLIPEGRIPFPGGRPHVSYQLAATCALYPGACAAGAEAAGEAYLMTKLLYHTFEPPEGSTETPGDYEGDAFQHCYWSGLTTLAVGALKAEKITTRFEAYGSDNDPGQRRFDMNSNARGRRYAQGLSALGPARGRAGLIALCR